MKQNSKNIIYFALFTLLGLVCLLGVVLPVNNQIKAVGNLQVSALKNGLSLFQADRNFYYTVSPFNDYFVLKNGTRNSLITKEELFADNFTSNLNNSRLTNIQNSLKAYFNVYFPSITFTTSKNIQVNYSTQTDNQTLTVTTKINLPQSINQSLLGSTLTYNPDDFIFDKSGNLYTFQSSEDIKLFSDIYGLNLVYFNDEPRIEIPNQAIYIMNPKLSSTIKVSTNQGQKLFLNRQNKIIELEKVIDPQTNEVSNSIQIEVIDNLKEVLKKI